MRAPRRPSERAAAESPIWRSVRFIGKGMIPLSADGIKAPSAPTVIQETKRMTRSTGPCYKSRDNLFAGLERQQFSFPQEETRAKQEKSASASRRALDGEIP
jgi:hypothetical protein